MKINANEFNAAIDMIEAQKGISRETVILALEDAISRAIKKKLDEEEGVVNVSFDLEKGLVTIEHLKTVVDDVNDEDNEIYIEEAQEIDPNAKVGNQINIPVSDDIFKNATLLSIRSIMRQKFAEAERDIISAAFIDKVGTMITGRVEFCEDSGASINIGRTSVFLPRRDMIGDETFKTGDTIKLYVSKASSAKNGIQVSRSSSGFLEALFKEEIPEIYNDTIKIKASARRAGERSKIAVISKDPSLDPAATCIGSNGSKIQKIVNQLGNGTNKEKIDVILYSENKLVFIAEALKPASIAGIYYDEEINEATVIVKDDSYSKAIGRKGVNVSIAAKITGVKLDLLTESKAKEMNFKYVTIEEINEIAKKEKAENAINNAKKEENIATNSFANVLPKGYVAPQERVYVEDTNDFDTVLEEKAEEEESEILPSEDKEVAPSKEEKKNETVKVEVKTTSSLADLEASLQAEADKNKANASKGKKKRKVEETKKEEEVKVAPTEPKERMSIYTEEELKAIEEEESIDEEYDDSEEVNYDDYDDYYDEGK